MDAETMETVAAASAECGMQRIANWLPADRQAEMRELLFDLTMGAVYAYLEARRGWLSPVPSEN